MSEAKPLDVIIFTDAKTEQPIILRRSEGMELSSIVPFDNGSKVKVIHHGNVETYTVKEAPGQALARFTGGKLDIVAPPGEAVDLKKILGEDSD